MNELIEIKKICTPEVGSLSFFEVEKDIPFEIKRIYYIYEVPAEEKRGMHAHKALKQVLWCPFGSIEIVLDNGEEKKSFLLDAPYKLLFVGPGIWRDMFWKKDGSVLCVAASMFYNEDDYIRNYDEFLKYEKEGFWKDENKF